MECFDICLVSCCLEKIGVVIGRVLGIKIIIIGWLIYWFVEFIDIFIVN